MSQKLRKEDEDKREGERKRGPNERVFISTQNQYSQKKVESKHYFI